MSKITYSWQTTPFGQIIFARTKIGICYIAFAENKSIALNSLKAKFPKSTLNKQTTPAPIDFTRPNKEKLDLQGTLFQQQVWRALQEIPTGKTSSYSKIAKKIGQPKAYRAVGTAIGKNPIALLIPCHRVIKSNGKTGSYMWGAERKQEILKWEANKLKTT